MIAYQNVYQTSVDTVLCFFQVINEVLRLTSPAPAVYREALKDTKLLGTPSS